MNYPTHKPDLLVLLVIAVLVITLFPEAAPLLLQQIIQVIGDGTWPAVVLALGTALIDAFKSNRPS